MASISCIAQVGNDYTLAIPRMAQQKLDLRRGDSVEVTIRKLSRRRRVRANPLTKVVAIGKGGPTDGAENHDKYLYGKRSAARLR